MRLEVSAAGAALTGLLTGTAVTQGAYDRTAGRLAKVGDPGIGGSVSLAGITPLHERNLPPGNYRYGAGDVPGGPESASWGHILWVLEASHTPGTRVYMSFRSTSSAVDDTNDRAWIAWQGQDPSLPLRWSPLPVGAFMVGKVAQASGRPAGAMLEFNTNTNGSYLRLADGTQICWRASAIATDPAAFVGTPVSIDTGKLKIGRWV